MARLEHPIITGCVITTGMPPQIPFQGWLRSSFMKGQFRLHLFDRIKQLPPSTKICMCVCVQVRGGGNGVLASLQQVINSQQLFRVYTPGWPGKMERWMQVDHFSAV